MSLNHRKIAKGLGSSLFPQTAQGRGIARMLGANTFTHDSVHQALMSAGAGRFGRLGDAYRSLAKAEATLDPDQVTTTLFIGEAMASIRESILQSEVRYEHQS